MQMLCSSLLHRGNGRPGGGQLTGPCYGLVLSIGAVELFTAPTDDWFMTWICTLGTTEHTELLSLLVSFYVVYCAIMELPLHDMIWRQVVCIVTTTCKLELQVNKCTGVLLWDLSAWLVYNNTLTDRYWEGTVNYILATSNPSHNCPS